MQKQNNNIKKNKFSSTREAMQSKKVEEREGQEQIFLFVHLLQCTSGTIYDNNLQEHQKILFTESDLLHPNLHS